MTDHPTPLLALNLVRQLHSPRSFSGDGYGWTVCAECRQTWPCATEEAIRKAVPEGSCAGCLGRTVHHTCGREPDAERTQRNIGTQGVEISAADVEVTPAPGSDEDIQESGFYE